MALSPFNLGTGKNSTDAQPRSKGTSDRLSLSQALTITAGLAGLVGLCSGVIIRFSLANSPNARFLSPLQTFPALSNWSPERLSESSPSPYKSGAYKSDAYSLDDAEPQFEQLETPSSDEGVDSFDRQRLDPQESGYPQQFESQSLEDTWADESFSRQTEESAENDALDARTFDSFAKRSAKDAAGAVSDPWQRLEQGPQLSRPADEILDNEAIYDDLERSESNYYEKAYDDPTDEPQYEASPYDYGEEGGDRVYSDDSTAYDRGYSSEEGY